MIKDYYHILDIPNNASQRSIKVAYRELALKWHPDHNSSSIAKSKFIEIHEAYSVLSDSESRELYDLQWQAIFRSGLNSEKLQRDDKPFSEENHFMRSRVNQAVKEAEWYSAMSYAKFKSLLKEVLKETNHHAYMGFLYTIRLTLGLFSLYYLYEGILYGDFGYILIGSFIFIIMVLINIRRLKKTLSILSWVASLFVFSHSCTESVPEVTLPDTTFYFNKVSVLTISDNAQGGIYDLEGSFRFNGRDIVWRQYSGDDSALYSYTARSITFDNDSKTEIRYRVENNIDIILSYIDDSIVGVQQVDGYTSAAFYLE